MMSSSEPIDPFHNLYRFQRENFSIILAKAQERRRRDRDDDVVCMEYTTIDCLSYLRGKTYQFSSLIALEAETVQKNSTGEYEKVNLVKFYR